MALDWEKIPASDFEKGNTLHKKITSGYRRVDNDFVYNARRIWDIKPTDNPNKRWDKEFNQAIADVPEGSRIYVPGARFENEATLEIRRNVSIIGDVERTVFSGPGNQPVIYIGHGAAGATFKNFVTTHQNKAPQIGYLGDGTYSKDFEPYAAGSGMMVQGVVTIEGVRGFRLSGHAFYIFGAVESATPTDSSNAKIVGCFANENEGGGYIIDGPDANFMTLERVSASDNKMFALWDSSFLGLNVVGLMSHYNKMGAIWSGVETARTHIYGAYDESGSAPSYLGPKCFVSGFLGSGFTGPGMYQEGPNMYGQQRWGEMSFRENAIHYGNTARFQKWGEELWAMAHTDNPIDISYGYAGSGAVLRNPYNRVMNPDGRKVEKPGLFANIAYIGDCSLGAMPSRYFLQEINMNFYPGAKFTNSACNGRNPVEWVCIKQGWGSNAIFKAYGNGSGLFSEAPGKELLPVDAGWKYYATDHKKEYIWTGTEFI